MTRHTSPLFDMILCCYSCSSDLCVKTHTYILCWDVYACVCAHLGSGILVVVQSTCGHKWKGTLFTPSSSPPHFSHLRLSNLRGAWVTVPNLGMVAPCSCFISFSEGCCESGPQSKFYQEVSATLSMPLHMQG